MRASWLVSLLRRAVGVVGAKGIGGPRSMRLAAEPRAIMRIPYGGYWPGLGHQITTLCYVLLHCQESRVYPVLQDDSANAYGAWTDYFEPFWDESERQRILAKDGLEIIDSDLHWARNRKGLFGDRWSSLGPQIEEIFRRIFVVREPVLSEIGDRIARLDLPLGYSSVHVRRGDKTVQFAEYGAMTTEHVVGELARVLRSHGVEDVFLMTDEAEVLEIMRRSTPFQVHSLCPADADGDPQRIRTASGHMMNLLTDIMIAQRAHAHFQTVNSRVSKLVRLLREDRDCFHVFDPLYTVYTKL